MPYLLEADDHFLINLDAVAVFAPVAEDGKVVAYRCLAIDGTLLGRVSVAAVESLRTEIELAWVTP